MHTSITYNTHLKKFVLVGCEYYPFDGVYLSTSDNLIHWTEAVKILPMENGNIQHGGLHFPVLLDPTDDSRNFERTGHRPYLYAVLQHDDVNTIDVIRQQITLDSVVERR